jgi:hypothetical protein
MQRMWQIDVARGLMLVLMTITHLPTRFSEPAGQPLGFVSAAEGFVLLSAFMAGLVYTQRMQASSIAAMRSAFWQRALKLYVCQATLLVFLFTVIAAVGLRIDHPAVRNLLDFYLQEPVRALLGGLALVYNPPLLDILPLYVLFMLVSPVVLSAGLRGGWTPILLASLALWLASQFDLSETLYAATLARTPLHVPYRETGAFDTFAWQFVWVLGLWMGCEHALAEAPPPRPPRWMVVVALAVALAGFVWRHWIGQTAFPAHPQWSYLFDKWQLGPLRLIEFMALLLLAMRYGTALLSKLPRPHWLESLGRASLPVFCAHLVVVLIALAWFGEANAQRSWGIDIGIVVGGFAVLFAVARISNEIDAWLAQRSVALRAHARS